MGSRLAQVLITARNGGLRRRRPPRWCAFSWHVEEDALQPHRQIEALTSHPGEFTLCLVFKD